MVKKSIIYIIHLILFCALYFMHMLMEAWGGFFAEEGSDLSYIFKFIIGLAGTLLILIFVRRVYSITIPYSIKKADLGLGFLIAFSIIMVGSVIEYLVFGSELIVDFSQWKTAFFAGLFVASMGILEEVFFRGVLYEFNKRYLSFLPNAIIGSILFTVIHILDLDTGWEILFYFSFSMLAYYLRKITHSLGASIAFHFSNNFMVALISQDIGYQPIIYLKEFSKETVTLFYQFLIPGLVVIIFMLLWKFYKEKNIDQTSSKRTT